ncbi:bifunctional metallophosphatase/5'-nucleotidase [Novosphingobium percolationis]|uniref:bifunctional metallophosphatase/5'-nucleotidase n=1 Tax=Novosphingobium percolationis TaxID=2871811 RepID=UPI00296E398D|nr:bifunctional metallophosphatase/5'-nucleotidase [Novosphingobium percolationis]
MAVPARFAPLLTAALLAGCAAPMAGRSAFAPVEVGVIAFNDFHGSIEPPRQSVIAPDGSGGQVQVPAGGAAWFASALDSIRAKYPNHLTVSAGDMISASQLASSLYLDEPTIGVMNRIGVDFNAVGNHEFDRGRDELLRMQNGGCAKFTAKEPCQLEKFPGASFRYLAASTLTGNGGTLFPATGLKTFGTGKRRVSVGVIGLALKGTPELVNPAGIKGLTFADEADTINAAVPVLKAQGADAVVVLIHQGGKTQGAPDPNGCNELVGEITPILSRLDPRVDLVVSGHTHWDYVCDWGKVDPGHPVLLTSAGVYGKEITDIRLEIDPATHRVVSKSARNVIVQSVPYTSAKGPLGNTDRYPQFAPRPDIAAYVQRYVDASTAFTARPMGKLSGPATKGEGAQSGMGGTLGNVIADAQRDATAAAGAQIAFMNPFGIRAPLVPAADGTVTFGDIYQTQPFGNQVVTETLTGAEIKAALEQGFDDKGPEQALSPSAGFAYRVDRAQPVGARIAGLTFNGKPLDMAQRYRVTINGFLALGGDGFTVFADKPEAVTGPTDLEALQTWLRAAPMRTVPAEARVTFSGAGG